MPTGSQRAVIFCDACRKFYVVAGWNRQLCDDCGSQRRREKVRGYVAAHRAKKPRMPPPTVRDRGERAAVQNSIPRDKGKFIIEMICGHKDRYELCPTEGEPLWCSKCVCWQEFTAGIWRPLCDAKLHRMTPYNTLVLQAAKGRPRISVCKSCNGDGL